MELQLGHSQTRPAYFHGLTMLPILREGDEVETEPVSGSQVRVGEVVTYRFDDKFPTRRVMDVDGQRRELLIMGDSLPDDHEYIVPFDDVLARLVRRRRGGRWLAVTDWRWRLHTLRVLARFRMRRSEWLRQARRVARGVRRRVSRVSV